MVILNMRKNPTIIVFLLVITSISFLNIYFFFQEVKKFENSVTNINNIDGIVVLTGDQFRIAKGIELLKRNPNKKLLISGVNKNINPVDIMKEFPSSINFFQCCIDIGKDAKNTFENIIETFEWMKSNEFTSIIIVTSDYHLPRVKLEINRFIDNQQIFYEAVKTDESDSILRLKKITLEYIKYIRTFLSIKIGINE
ncbi:MAG: hypothetical protein CMI88_01430 [Pelagibacteraceae bacterium]|nr:hypothetical protein [Pelagibacteraceae bacterium]|tara:strand:+ start:2035 stop:2625 length:591 start_codon:yes stop_codon:yes gene_type:complete